MAANLDIDMAVQTTLRALTLSEKALPYELLYSKQFDTTSRVAWIRAPSLNLGDALATGRADGFPLRSLFLFCDTLYINPDLRIISGKHRLQIEIFARRVVGSTLVFVTVPGCSISFGTPELPKDLTITFNGKFETPVIASGMFNVTLTHHDHDNAGEPVQESFPAPDGYMNAINYLDLIDDNGSLKSKGMSNDDLPRLLQMQLLVAQAHAHTEPGFSIALLNYVIATTDTPYSLRLNYEAVALRNALALESDVMSVPSVNIYASKQVLKARLTVAKSFEDAFHVFSAQKHASENRMSDALDVVAKSEDAIETYTFVLKIRQREYDNAVIANDKASATFAKNQNDLDQLRKNFEVGVKRFKKAEEIAAVKQVVLGIVEVVGAVALTVATFGTAAPVAAGAVAHATSTTVKAVTLLQQLQAIWDGLSAIWKDIKPVIEKLQELVNTTKSVVKALRELKSPTGEAAALGPVSQAPDVFNAIAEWRLFNLMVAEMEDSLREYDIDGRKGYFHALKTLVINGECFIQTQANVVAQGDNLAVAVLKGATENRNLSRLSKMAYKASNDIQVFGLLRRAMFDRLLAIRALVYLDFSTYLAAYNYHTMLPETTVIVLSPVKPVVDYLEDAARLQAAVVAYGARVQIQSRKFVVKSFGDGCTSATELAQQLSTTGRARITVDPADAIWAGFARIRMGAVRCYLDGVETASAIRLELRTSGSFFDRDFAALDATSEKKNVLTRSFLGDARCVLFEYSPTTRELICDGQYGRDREYTRHTPMTTWEVRIVDADKDSSCIDVSGVTAVVLEVECDVVWIGV
ncbi:hypothetical protein BKA62DRAFT_828790 [Auriculariales sp. MPI-PUGE-AT-0066]|nr:hypothetical protein BKA62DRAFT_828790 [Auriculariales sp. MPI-PUGE-AT-0066]